MMNNWNSDLFYGERLGDRERGEPHIAERGIFMSIEEFIPYRRLGWTGTKQTNAKADEIIRQQDEKAKEHDHAQTC